MTEDSIKEESQFESDRKLAALRVEVLANEFKKECEE